MTLQAAMKILEILAASIGALLVALWGSLKLDNFRLQKQMTTVRNDVSATRRTHFNSQISIYRLLAKLNADQRQREIINEAVINFAAEHADIQTDKPNGKSNGSGFH
jgi:hypothetical protein